MLSILIGAVAIFVFGAVWFTVLFGKKWAELMDFNPASAYKYKDMGMAKPLVANFLSNVVVASVVYYIFPQFLALTFLDFLKVMLVIWLGFSFPIYANGAIWERKSWMLVLINCAQGVISISIVSAVIYFMN